MVGWHHELSRHEFEQAPGEGEGQGSLLCCSPRGRKESDMNEQLKTTTTRQKWWGRGEEKDQGVGLLLALCPFKGVGRLVCVVS